VWTNKSQNFFSLIDEQQLVYGIGAW